MRRYVASQASHPLSSLLVPLFFVSMGLQVDLGSLGNLSTTLSRARQHDLCSTIHMCMLSSQYQDIVQEHQGCPCHSAQPYRVEETLEAGSPPSGTAFFK